jgi:RimJ/RimL family protein N-acetyltransferase
MKVELFDRLKEHVVEYWNVTRDEEIRSLFPFTNTTLNESLELFNLSQKLGSSSFGKVIYVDGKYVGDIWIYGIDESDEKMAMLSIVIFDKKYWNKGIGTIAINQFANICFGKYDIEKLGAFTYSKNTRSLGVLNKVGFEKIELFVEDETESVYFEYHKLV